MTRVSLRDGVVARHITIQRIYLAMATAPVRERSFSKEMTAHSYRAEFLAVATMEIRSKVFPTAARRQERGKVGKKGC